MTRIRMMMLTMLAVFAVGAVSVASAFATEPELVSKGHPGVEVVKKGVTGEGVGKATLQIAGEGSLVCSKSTNKGTVTGLKTSEGTISFTGCEFAGLKCNNTGTPGEIKMEVALLFVYEVLASGELEPAVLIKLKPEAGLTVKCGSTQTLVLKGSFLASAKPANEVTNKGTFVATQKDGKPAVSEFEETKGGEKKKDKLVTSGSGTKAFTEVESGEEIEGKLTFEEEVELLT
jgi:hypothetical protein